MPKKTVSLDKMELTLDARPDRLDLRDLPYRPPVGNLPAQFPEDKLVKKLLPGYLAAGLILNQGREGACTGFGLAAVINYLRWSTAFQAHQPIGPADLVSTRMLYHLARFYDEWPGEDYEGSSCRGALKGWQRHGVCLETLWPYDNGQFRRPLPGWDTDAVTRPLGVYYRIQRGSVVDMQSAILQAGAIYVSAEVHRGWRLGPASGRKLPTHEILPVIQPDEEVLGGHAFAIVGYNSVGFVVQNSWGDGWGWSGFAVLPYEDWVAHGTDAWVAALGAPVTRVAPTPGGGLRPASPQHFVRHGRRTAVGQLPSGSQAVGRDPLGQRPDAWTEENAYWHTLVTGNDGSVINRLPQAENESDNMRIVALEQPLEWFKSQGTSKVPRLVVYAHGGLNSEEESIARIRVLGPNFEANGIYPLFVTWKSGWAETIAAMIADAAKGVFGGALPPAKGFGHLFNEATDRALEIVSRNLLVRSMWSEMKENVARSSDPGRGVDGLADRLKDLSTAVGSKLEIHLAGHSAGSFVCGHLLSEFAGRELGAASCTLFAPACDLGFAQEHYVAAISGGRLDRDRFLLHVLADDLERDDTVGPYRKSLLYLVSRALERWHKTPLLGLATSFDPDCVSDEFWHGSVVAQVANWQEFFWKGSAPSAGFAKAGVDGGLGTLNVWQEGQVDTGAGNVKSTHGSFDNSITHIGGMIEAIRGGSLAKAITPLNY